MDQETRQMLSGSSAASEGRTLDPHLPQWVTAQTAADRLHVKIAALYKWIYGGKIIGTKKEDGRLMLPQAEMNRLIGLKDAGELEATMRAGQGRHGKKAPTAKAPTAKAPKAPAKHKRSKKAAPPKPALRQASAPAGASVSAPDADLLAGIAAVKMPTAKLAELMNLHAELVRQFDRLGLRVNLTPY